MNNQLTTLPPGSDYPALGPGEEFTPPPPKFQWHKFLITLRRFWWIPVLTLLLGLAGAVAHFFLTPPVFYSVSRMWETEKLRLPGGAAFTEDTQNNLGTQSDLLRSDRLRQLALQRLQSIAPQHLAKDKNGEPMEVNIRVLQSAKSSVFAVEANSANPAYTPAYLDALMHEYMEYKRNVRKVVSGGTLASISEQVLRLERDLKTDQEALTEFQRTNNLGILEQEGNIAGGYLAKLKTQLSDYQLESKLLDATALEQESASPNPTNSLSSLFASLRSSGGAGSGSETAGQTTSREIELLKLQREKLSEFLRPKHPKIVKLDADIQRGEQLIEIYRRQNLDQIATARQALKIRIASVESSIKEWEAKVAAANTRIAAAERLKQNVASNQSLYDRLISLLQNVDISRNIDQETLAILEPASPAKRSYQTAKSMLSLALFGGLVAGLGIIFLIAIRDDRFNSLQEVNDQMGDTVVGQVPEMPELKNGAPLALLEAQDERHIYAESYRSLRSALMFLAVDGARPQVLLITSAVPNEGKSTITTNLARTLALGGARVLLIDGDMRKGHLHDLLGLKSQPGLAEMLRHPSDSREFIQTNSLANFSFIARGAISNNPGDLFLTSALDQKLALLRQEYDYILIDSSPVFAADDATTLAPKVDGTLFIVRSRFSRARAVREALNLLHQRQARVLGLVLNRADATARSYHYYNYSEYYQAAKPAA
jgi:succinoglycan biosynthesis transport protein ExoP